MSAFMDDWTRQLQQMMNQIFLLVLVLIILLFVVWIIFEFYPKWRRVSSGKS